MWKKSHDVEVLLCLRVVHPGALCPSVRSCRRPEVCCVFEAGRGVAERSLLHWSFISLKVETKVRCNPQKLIFTVCILLNPILLIPPDAALAIRHNVFFIGALFNNTLIDGYRGIAIRGLSVFQVLEILKQWSITNCSTPDIRVFMISAHPRSLYPSGLGGVQASLWRAVVWVMVGGEGEWYKVVQGL